MGKNKYMGLYDMFICTFRKKKVTAEEPKNLHRTKSQMPVFLFTMSCPKIAACFGISAAHYSIPLVILNP